MTAAGGYVSQDSSYQSVNLPRTDRSLMEDFERHTNRSIPSVHTSGAFSDTTWSNVDYERAERAKSEELWINSMRNSINNNGLLGVYRGLGGSKCKGQQHISRKNRISVDHLSARTRKAQSPCKYGVRGDDDFQGSITVNENAFQRLLNLSTPVGDKDDDFYQY